MKKKILLIIIDGLGDEPIPDFNFQTPLEFARTPNFDSLAEKGILGRVKPFLAHTALPTSEDCHLALFGYNPERYHVRRGFFTAEGAGIKMKKGDIALRGNFATIDDKMRVVDRRAGRIKNPTPLIEAINNTKIEGVRFIVKSAKEHRLAIVMRGKNLSSYISDGDPHYAFLEKGLREIKPLKNTKSAQKTAAVLNQFLKFSHQLLKEHPFNKKRIKKGLLPANYILTRGASRKANLVSFEQKYGLKAAGIAGKVLYQQIIRVLKMNFILVKGANGLPNTNLKGKVKASLKALKKYDFVFLHIKATDSLAEDGFYKKKKEFIEKIDRAFAPFLKLKNTLVVISCDHSTCSLKKRHCLRPCPLLISGGPIDKQKKFSEKECKKGALGLIPQQELMKTVLRFAGYRG